MCCNDSRKAFKNAKRFKTNLFPAPTMNIHDRKHIRRIQSDFKFKPWQFTKNNLQVWKRLIFFST